MSLQVTLLCDECGRSESPTLYQRWAPNGCLELAGGTRFYVDGEQVRCPEHTDQECARSQRRSVALVGDTDG